MQSLMTVGMCILATVLYGIIHDQITARICVEYFTIGHPRVIDSDDPTLLALAWGIIATWWIGALLGVPLSIAARAGKHPRRTPTTLVRPIGQLMVICGIAALFAGLIGWLLAREAAVFLVEPLASEVPREKHTAFLVDLWAHSASYLFGFAGGLVLIVRVWRSRMPIAP